MNSSSSHPNDLAPMLTDGAPPVTVPVTGQDDLLSSIEARLTQEVGDLAAALIRFDAAAQAIREELPVSFKFGKLITGFLGLFSLQLANALLKDGNTPLLLDDGAQYLHKLGLSVDELFRELDVDGRRFFAVAFVEQRPSQVAQQGDARAGTGDQ